MKTYNWYRFVFADGYTTIRRGMSAFEIATMERQHGELMSKTYEYNA